MSTNTESNHGSSPVSSTLIAELAGTSVLSAVVPTTPPAPVPASVIPISTAAGAGYNADRLFARMEKNLRRLIAISLDDAGTALQLAAYLRRASLIAEKAHQDWMDSYGDVICEVVGVECGDSCGFHD